MLFNRYLYNTHGSACQGLYNHSSVIAGLRGSVNLSPQLLLNTFLQALSRLAELGQLSHAMNCCLIISPLSEEQAAFSSALVYKYLRG